MKESGNLKRIYPIRTDSSADYLKHVDETHERRDDCKFCGFRPPNKAHLERHLERDTKNCQYCDFVTCKEVALARHLIDHLQNKVSLLFIFNFINTFVYYFCLCFSVESANLSGRAPMD